MVINKPERYMKVLKYSLVPAGYIMNILGKLVTNQRVELLGHYLKCSGKAYTLNNKVLAETIDKPNTLITPLPGIKYGFIVKPGHLEDNYILGKFFMVIDENGYATIIDVYRFYPWSGNDLSFRDSEKNDNWALIQLSKRIKIRLPTRFIGKAFRVYLREKGDDKEIKWSKVNPLEISKDFSCGRLLDIGIYPSLDTIFIELSIRDKIFYFLGRQFNVRTNKFKLEDKLFEELKREWYKEKGLWDNHTDLYSEEE